jgi:hypothetical protein
MQNKIFVQILIENFNIHSYAGTHTDFEFRLCPLIFQEQNPL